jgi:hypothetical protein
MSLEKLPHPLDFYHEVFASSWRPGGRRIDNYPELEALVANTVVVEVDASTGAVVRQMGAWRRIALPDGQLRWVLLGEDCDYLTEEINLPVVVVWPQEHTAAVPAGIQEIHGFKVTCGGCHEDFDDPEGYTTLFDTVPHAIQRVKAVGWVVTGAGVTCGGCAEGGDVDA